MSIEEAISDPYKVRRARVLVLVITFRRKMYFVLHIDFRWYDSDIKQHVFTLSYILQTQLKPTSSSASPVPLVHTRPRYLWILQIAEDPKCHIPGSATCKDNTQ